jgi:hypothetical protein
MQVAVIPSSPFSRAFDTDLSGFVLLDKVEGKMPYDAQVGGSMPDSYSAVVLAKRNVETPMQPVFDAPVTSGCLSKDLGITGQTGNVVACLTSSFVTNLSLGFDHPKGCELCPLGFVLEPVHLGSGSEAADFNSPMLAVRGFIGLMGKILEPVFFGVLEEELYLLMEGALIPFKGDNVIPFLFHNLFDDFPLTAMASIVTIQPLSAKTLRSSGMAVISLDFSSVLTWPSTNRCSVAQALTMWIAAFLDERS